MPRHSPDLNPRPIFARASGRSSPPRVFSLIENLKEQGSLGPPGARQRMSREQQETLTSLVAQGSLAPIGPAGDAVAATLERLYREARRAPHVTPEELTQ
jgi:hypothetical protein